jgi:hypothetical protein
VGLEFEPRGPLLLDPHLQSIVLWLFWRWGLSNYLPRLASIQHPADLSLTHYRCELLALGLNYFFMITFSKWNYWVKERDEVGSVAQ